VQPEHFSTKWKPVRRKKMRPIRESRLPGKALSKGKFVGAQGSKPEHWEIPPDDKDEDQGKHHNTLFGEKRTLKKAAFCWE
jgi:hypothetical protein